MTTPTNTNPENNPTTRAQNRAEMPAGTSGILARRTLTNDFKRLAELLEPGMRVLDLGCGNGAITRGIAEAVGPTGYVLGIDSSRHLLEEAQNTHADLAQLHFQKGDIYALDALLSSGKLLNRELFDVVVSARVFQWLEHPQTALESMLGVVKVGGKVLVLDYNHLKLEQYPAQPTALTAVLQRYLDWRSDAGMDNQIADHLAGMFEKAGLQNIKITPHHESTQRGDPDFVQRVGIKVDVVASRGHQLVQEGWISETQRATAELEGREWANTVAESQTLYLLAVQGEKV
jgi:ubiquinone/menaquinone biosynthesis C-methylase UbiE